MSDNPLSPYGIIPDDTNPLRAGQPTWADAWTYNQQRIQNYIEQQRAIAEQRGLWDPQTGLPTQAGAAAAGQQYAGALVGSSGAPKFARETIGIVPGVNMRVNPSVPELKRLLSKHEALRLVGDGGQNIAVAPAADTIHDEMLNKLSDAAHPLATGQASWIIGKDGRVTDSNAENPDTEVPSSQWPLSLQLLYGKTQ